MKNFDIIILGAGASGCMCAITAAGKGKNILLIDKLSKAGKKLLATGNGRCNLTNLRHKESENYYNQNIDKFLSRFGPSKTLNFFQSMGLMTLPDNENRVYPFSNSAKSVVDVLNNTISLYKNITLSLENEVEKIEKNGERFSVYTTNGIFSCNKLVVATGGKSFENILKDFNLRIKPFVPSLVALKTQSTRTLDGTKISNVKVEGFCGGKTQSETGEVLFKDNGISGIVTFNISTLFARQANFQGHIKIDLMPQLSYGGLCEFLKDRRQSPLPVKNFFDGLFVPQLVYYILNKVKISNEEKPCIDLTHEEIEKMAFEIKNMTLNVKGHYDNNQVYSGGVLLEDLTDNLESKSVNNLYFCGEVCDVDGICGGYNLQWAWTSGRIVGESL